MYLITLVYDSPKVDEKYAHRRSSIRIVSIVNSRFHWTRHGSLAGSTCRERQNIPCFVEYVLSYFACLVVYTWQIDLGDEGDIGRDVGIFVAAMNLEAVDSVLVYALVMILAYCPLSMIRVTDMRRP